MGKAAESADRGWPVAIEKSNFFEVHLLAVYYKSTQPLATFPPHTPGSKQNIKMFTQADFFLSRRQATTDLLYSLHLSTQRDNLHDNAVPLIKDSFITQDWNEHFKGW